jgi:predicted DNA-binding transcriptional regulator AlpA
MRPMEPLIKRKEVMALLGISRYTLNKYLAAGMPMVRITSHGRFVKCDVLDWVKRNAPAQGEGGPGETVGLVHSTSPATPSATAEEKE